MTLDLARTTVGPMFEKRDLHEEATNLGMTPSEAGAYIEEELHALEVQEWEAEKEEE